MWNPEDANNSWGAWGENSTWCTFPSSFTTLLWFNDKTTTDCNLDKTLLASYVGYENRIKSFL